MLKRFYHMTQQAFEGC